MALSDSCERVRRRKTRAFWVGFVLAMKLKLCLFKNIKQLGDTNKCNVGADVQVPRDAQGRGRDQVDWARGVPQRNCREPCGLAGRRRRVLIHFYVTGRTTNQNALATARASVRDGRFWIRPAYKTCHGTGGCQLQLAPGRNRAERPPLGSSISVPALTRALRLDPLPRSTS